MIDSTEEEKWAKWVKPLVQLPMWAILIYCIGVAALGLFGAFYCGIAGFFGNLAQGCDP